MFRRGAFRQDGKITGQLVAPDPPPDVGIPVIGMFRFIHRIYAAGENDVLSGPLKGTHRHDPDRLPEKRQVPGS